ncbi:ketosamine-3-kinase-like [Clavelina lepadiformis]|uniref:ketosamine-3-kinase-like n=1 Tax=Clavelina lepadiformis TaxID=159417 RepID=UPI0040427040
MITTYFSITNHQLGMEELLREEFGCKEIRSIAGKSGGLNSDGSVYSLDGEKVFVKRNSAEGSRTMYEGEYLSLTKLDQTQVIKVPKPIKLFNRGNMTFFVMEYLPFYSLRHEKAGSLGEKLAQLHLYNQNLGLLAAKNQCFVGKSTQYVDKFGFDAATCCGFIPMSNEWNENWLTFYATNRLKAQIDLVVSTYQAHDVANLWSEVEWILPKLFPVDLKITPSLLHGDFWEDNVGIIGDEPCVFDPGSYYGHSEFDLALSRLNDGFPPGFYEAYHKLIPKQPGFENRQKAYMLFHTLNRWNHFGSGYKERAVTLMKTLLRTNL